MDKNFQFSQNNRKNNENNSEEYSRPSLNYPQNREKNLPRKRNYERS